MNKQKSYLHPPTNPNFFSHTNYKLFFFLCNLGTPNSAAMGCSQPKLSRTGLRNILAFLKVKLQHFLGGVHPHLLIRKHIEHPSDLSILPYVFRGRTLCQQLRLLGGADGTWKRCRDVYGQSNAYACRLSPDHQPSLGIFSAGPRRRSNHSRRHRKTALSTFY